MTRSKKIRQAVILAAGMGSRLAGVHDGLPKGFVDIAGKPLITYSLNALKDRGVERIFLVVGAWSEAYKRLAAEEPIIRCIDNPAFATTGSLASLACALPLCEDQPFLLLESDLFYDPCALDALLSHDSEDVLLVSGETKAGDEVWVGEKDGVLHELSKDRAAVQSDVAGEFVGLLCLSAPLGKKLLTIHEDTSHPHWHPKLCYETDALVWAAQEYPINLCKLPRLLWGEIDDASHLRRIREEIAPAILAKQFASGSESRTQIEQAHPTNLLPQESALDAPIAQR
jgi:choline kinase